MILFNKRELTKAKITIRELKNELARIEYLVRKPIVKHCHDQSCLIYKSVKYQCDISCTDCGYYHY